MADFREELHVERHKTFEGKPSMLAMYDWCHAKTDLADNTVEVVAFGECDTIGAICNLIDSFEPTEQDVKLGIKAFLETDRYYSSEEY